MCIYLQHKPSSSSLLENESLPGRYREAVARLPTDVRVSQVSYCSDKDWEIISLMICCFKPVK